MNDVTTPKLPPPPRIAQNRSGFSSALARTRSPSASTTSASSRLSIVEPVLAGQVAEAAAEREAADAGGRDDPARRREAVLVGRAVDLAPGAAAADAHGARLAGRPRCLQQREVDHDAVVARCRGRRRCGRRRGPRAAARARARSATTAATSSASAAARDQRRAPVDHRVVDRARLLVVGVARARSAAPEAGQLAACAPGRGRDGAHAVSSSRRSSDDRTGRRRAVMTRPDPFARLRGSGRRRWSDLTIVRRGPMHDSRPAPPPSTFPFVGRSAELETLRALHAARGGRGPPRRAARRRGGLGQEPARARVRRRGGRRRRARALRRLRRGGAHALRAVRRGARPPRARRPTRRAARRARRGGGELTRLLPDLAAGSASCRRRSRPTPTPSATGCTRRSPTCSRRRPRRPVLLVLEDAHWADAPTLLLLRHLARAAGGARLLLLATFRDTEADCRASSPRRSPICAAPTTSSACGSRALRRRGHRVRAQRRRRPGRAPELAARSRAHRRQRVPGLRALARAGRDRPRRVAGGESR